MKNSIKVVLEISSSAYGSVASKVHIDCESAEPILLFALNYELEELKRKNIEQIKANMQQITKDLKK